MLRSSASRVTLVGAEDDLTLLVVAHLEVWGVAIERVDAAASGAPPADALVVVLGAAGGSGEAPDPGDAVDAIVAAAASGVPTVAVVLEPATADALDAALAAALDTVPDPAPGSATDAAWSTAAPSELLIGVPRGRDLFEAVESAVTSSASEVAARPRPPALDALPPSGPDEPPEG